MAMGQPFDMRRAVRAGVGLLAGAACLAALPSAVAAVTGDAPLSQRELSVAAIGGLSAFTPVSVDPKLMESLRRAAKARGEEAANLFRFTPARTAKSGTRSVTLAVRVDSDIARAVSVRNAAEDAGRRMNGVDPVAFNLGVARGYQSFAQTGATAQTGKQTLTLSSDIGDINAPDLRSFTPAKSSSGKSRFSTVVELDDTKALPGSAPRTFNDAGEMSVDVAGAYRVAKNLKVTAGIRYSSERDRLTPPTDNQTDSQAVYVGTKFQF